MCDCKLQKVQPAPGNLKLETFSCAVDLMISVYTMNFSLQPFLCPK